MGFTSSLADTFGMLFLGVSISGVLLGITCLQMFPQESATIKLIVAFMGALDIMAYAFNIHAIYHYMFSINYFDLEAYLIPVCISRKHIHQAGNASALVNGITVSKLKSFEHVNQENAIMIYIPFSVAIFDNAVIAITTTYYLRRQKAHFLPLRSVIETFFAYLALDTCFGKVYLNSYMTIMNARKSLRQNSGHDVQLNPVIPSVVSTFEGSAASAMYSRTSSATSPREES
ncbi:hypothetical protein PUNSTDRAFT_47197 [Punctularia strigosozonata HHB-11173 SS5]|uniref:Uncharacterized protein n=1 Tax=Punctularia strigosozonata (strain HHB-11173) TaxID=741275 RepID=R7S3G2_PUNST|nr:uncharacterized protein PUNSTDRAFT_47197 [Punctularia strigosozonata HHB-11173 SS5]EIN04950.1 hypothetical protein PUNSTDRAFT_47197 [Punctularia strigosozonata HHB-11173 SS5]